MHRFRNVALAAVLVLAVASCADAQRTASPPTVSDSAGIRLVVNEWPTNTAATLANAPTLEIGSGSDPAGELSGVVAAVRLGDGRIAIAEQSTRSVKIFDTGGRFVRALGRQGAGPGEFAAITRLQRLRGDSIAAFDGLRATLAVFDTTGRLARTERLAGGMGGLQLAGLMSNGTMILTRAYNPMFSSTSRLERDSIVYVAARTGSAALDTILTVPGSEVFLFAGADFSSRNPLPFGRVSLIAVQDDRLAIATGDVWQVEMRGPSGELREMHRVRREPVAVTKDDITRRKRDELERLRGTRVQAAGGGGAPPDMQARMVEQRRRMLEVIPYPTTHALYDSLLVGSGGEVWVRSAGTPAGQPRRWIVLSRDGAALGTVSAPARLRLLEIGDDFVVAVRSDDDDVEHVGIYPLRRERGGTTR